MKNNFIILVAITLVLGSCCDENFTYDNNHRHIRGHGAIKTESISVENFTSVKLENVANVDIQTGKSFLVEFTAYENILDYIEAEVIRE